MGALTQALRLTPADAAAQYNLGVAAARLGRWPEAVTALTQAWKLQPEAVDAAYQLGLAHCQLAQWPEALRVLQQALELDPAAVKVRSALGLVYGQLGQWPEAIAALQQALALAPAAADAAPPARGAVRPVGPLGRSPGGVAAGGGPESGRWGGPGRAGGGVQPFGPVAGSRGSFAAGGAAGRPEPGRRRRTPGGGPGGLGRTGRDPAPGGGLSTRPAGSPISVGGGVGAVGPLAGGRAGLQPGGVRRPGPRRRRPVLWATIPKPCSF